MNQPADPDNVQSIAANLPFLRRYARALTGNQDTGDLYAVATLEALLKAPERLSESDDGRTALFHAFHQVWAGAGAPLGQADTPLSHRAQNHMAGLTANSREALLLSAIEGFTPEEIGRILQVDAAQAVALIDAAKREMLKAVAGSVLIIEDEAIIAMDIQGIAADMGHRVTGIARTHAAAVALAGRDRPDLILTDIQLADKSSGIDAVKDILTRFDQIPVIFITAFPERLLTGQRPEPAFLITKPFTEDQIRSAVSQAMFFASTETLIAGSAPQRALG